jgi:hypothetical protein
MGGEGRGGVNGTERNGVGETRVVVARTRTSIFVGGREGGSVGATEDERRGHVGGGVMGKTQPEPTNRAAKRATGRLSVCV